jgi:hypothetical protein
MNQRDLICVSLYMPRALVARFRVWTAQHRTTMSRALRPHVMRAMQRMMRGGVKHGKRNRKA